MKWNDRIQTTQMCDMCQYTSQRLKNEIHSKIEYTDWHQKILIWKVLCGGNIDYGGWINERTTIFSIFAHIPVTLSINSTPVFFTWNKIPQCIQKPLIFHGIIISSIVFVKVDTRGTKWGIKKHTSRVCKHTSRVCDMVSWSTPSSKQNKGGAREIMQQENPATKRTWKKEKRSNFLEATSPAHHGCVCNCAVCERVCVYCVPGAVQPRWPGSCWQLN